MSKKIRTLLVQGLVVAGCTGLTSRIAAKADEPTTRGHAPVASPRAGVERYLLLTDGRMIPGVIGQDKGTFIVTQKVGTIPIPARQVERAFDSVEEAFRYRLERAPEDDPAERLRLARWCLTWHLEKEAKVLLEQVIEISPDHGPARAMLAKINQTEATRVARDEMKVDEDVRKTGGAEVSEDRPGALDSAVLRGAERRMGISGLPVIFDLPPALAVQRAEQFKQYVHPVLQAYCVKCHNAEYNGPFQLVPVKSSRQRTPDAMRANLDATLRLIDRESPERSELLSSTLRPHGTEAKQRPIFSGSNDRAYQILAAWATSLRPAVGSDRSASSPRMPTESGEAFAAERPRPGVEPLDELARGGRIPAPRKFPAMSNATTAGEDGRSYRHVEGQGMVPEDPRQADPREFPLPYMLGGPRPVVPGGPADVGNGRVPAPSSNRPPETRSPGAVRPGPGDPRTEQSGSSTAIPDKPKSGAGGSPAATIAKKKPVPIDPKALEKFLKKNTNRD